VGERRLASRAAKPPLAATARDPDEV